MTDDDESKGTSRFQGLNTREKYQGETKGSAPLDNPDTTNTLLHIYHIESPLTAGTMFILTLNF